MQNLRTMLKLAVAAIIASQVMAAAASPKPYSVMTDAQIGKMLGRVSGAKYLRVEIYSDPMESPFDRPGGQTIFTRRCRIEDSGERKKIIDRISELNPVRPIVPPGNSPMSMMLLGGYGPFTMRVVLLRDRERVFDGVFSLPGFDDKSPHKVSIGLFPDYRVGSFAPDPILAIESYMKSGFGNCADI